MTYREATIQDAQGIYDLERKVWGKTGATLDMIESRLKIFPEGCYVALQKNKIIGVTFFEIIRANQNFKTWYEYTDNGRIEKSHDLKGDTIFGIDLSVLDDFSGKGIGTNLLLKIAEYSIKKNIRKGVLGGRVPFYHKYSDMDINDYMRLKDKSGRLIDPELRFYTRAGLRIKKALPDYFEDPDSLDYGVLLEWSNPFYRVKSKLGKIIAAEIFKIGFRLEVLLSK